MLYKTPTHPSNFTELPSLKFIRHQRRMFKLLTSICFIYLLKLQCCSIRIAMLIRMPFLQYKVQRNYTSGKKQM